MRRGLSWFGRLSLVLLLTSLPGLALAQTVPRGIEPREIPNGTYRISLVQLSTGSYGMVLEPATAPPVRIFGGRRRTLTQTNEWAINSIRTDLGAFLVGLVPGRGGAAAAYVLYPKNVAVEIEGSASAGITLVFEDRSGGAGGGARGG